MALAWTFSQPLRLVLIFAKGAVLPEEVLNLLAKIDAERARMYRKIFDVTELTSTFSDDQIRQLAELVRQRNAQSPIGPIAIVANAEHTYRQAELFVSFRVTNQAVAIFREHHDARRWLDDQQPAA